MFSFLRNFSLILLLFMVFALQPLPRLYSPPLRQSEWMKQTTLRWSVEWAVYQLPVCHGPKMAAARCCLSEKFTQFQMWRKVTKANTNVLQIMRRDQTTRRLIWLSKVCGKELHWQSSSHWDIPQWSCISNINASSFPGPRDREKALGTRMI